MVYFAAALGLVVGICTGAFIVDAYKTCIEVSIETDTPELLEVITSEDKTVR